MKKLLIIASIAINVWFQFKNDLLDLYGQKHCPSTHGYSYGETYILKIPYDVVCAGGSK